MIHLLIHEARNIKLDDVDTVDPIIQVRCFNKKLYTKCMDDVGSNASVSWNEHMFFEPKDLTEHDLQNNKIQIKMMNKRLIKDSIIGTYDIDLSYIYFKEKHAILKQWVGLSNPKSKKFNELSGYLKISVSVIGPGDEQVPLTDDVGFERTDTEVLMLPPHISMKYYQLKFRIIKGENLPIMDSLGGTCDAYVKVTYLGKTIQTKTIQMKNNTVMWAQEIWLPVQSPLVSGRLVMTVMDYDAGSADDTVGSMAFDVAEILKRYEDNKKFPWYWKDIYGAPVGVTGKNTDEMNAIPELGSTWKGRILMQAICEDTDSPKMKITNVSDKVLQEAGQYMLPRKYEIKLEVSQGI